MAGSNACKVYYFGPQNPVELGVNSKNIIWIPLLEIKPLKENLTKISEYATECDTIVFTSPRGPRILREMAESAGEIITEIIKSKRIISIGEKTSRSIRKVFGVEPCCIPSIWDSLGLGELLCKIRPECALLLRARQATSILTEELDKCKIDYRNVELYDLIPRQDSLIELESSIYPMILSSSLIARTIIERIGCPWNRAIIALGRTTLNTIREMCGNSIEVLVPEKPDLETAVKLALTTKCS
jgi:uroporphyrinogen-III synthase